MKTTMKQLTIATILGLLFIVGNVNAKGKKVADVSSHEILTENALALENWMVDENFWNINVSIAKFNTTKEAENAMVLEKWMFTDFEKVDSAKDEIEEPLQMEEWMTDENIWIK
ncbi:MAG: hypothetical protein CSA36_06935 [Draconibacterium sp.]|nr:MAG: hypothetical protein CSA36_06935 [Draconibacterium sp.]